MHLVLALLLVHVSPLIIRALGISTAIFSRLRLIWSCIGCLSLEFKRGCGTKCSLATFNWCSETKVTSEVEMQGKYTRTVCRLPNGQAWSPELVASVQYAQSHLYEAKHYGSSAASYSMCITRAWQPYGFIHPRNFAPRRWARRWPRWCT